MIVVLWANGTRSEGRLVRNVEAASSVELPLCFPFYLQGVCLGMQLAVVEFSRNVLGWQGKCLL